MSAAGHRITFDGRSCQARNVEDVSVKRPELGSQQKNVRGGAVPSARKSINQMSVTNGTDEKKKPDDNELHTVEQLLRRGMERPLTRSILPSDTINAHSLAWKPVPYDGVRCVA